MFNFLNLKIMELNQEENMVRLCAKIGVFFANADGVYSEKEAEFVDKFLSLLKDKNQLTYDLELLVKHFDYSKCTIEMIIEETKNVLDSFDLGMHSQILSQLSALIEKVINADGTLHEKEMIYYKQWKNNFN